MKRFVFAALAVLLVWTVGRLVGQEAPDPLFDPASSLDFETPAGAPIAQPDENPQRNRYLDIMRAKAELMDEAELEAAIQQAEAEIQDLQARRMLADARETLLRLIETYPETPSADAARRMLGREAPPQESPAPSYDEDFSPRPVTAPLGFGVSPDFENPVRPLERGD